MAYRPLGKARVDPDNPRAFGVCQRCGSLFNAYNLNWQRQWRGFKIHNIRVQVCESCMDKMSPFLRQIVLPPDPPAIVQPRSPNYTIDEAGSYPPAPKAGIPFLLGGTPLGSSASGGTF